MRAKLVKTHKGEVAVKIEKEFSDAPALYDFLTGQGMYVRFEDVVDDLALPEVTYTMPLTNVAENTEYN